MLSIQVDESVHYFIKFRASTDQSNFVTSFNCQI